MKAIIFGIAVGISGLLVPLSATAQSNATATAQKEPARLANEFRFEGGAFIDFVKQLRAHYGTNDLDLLQVPNAAFDVEVPKMRIPDSTVRNVKLDGGEASRDRTDQTRNLRVALTAYNEISETGEGFLGKFVFNKVTAPSPDPVPFKAIVFFPPKSISGPKELSVRAYSMRGMSAENRVKLMDLIELEAHMTSGELQKSGGDRYVAQGQCRFHEGTELLIAKGGKVYIDLASALVEAYLRNAEKALKPVDVVR